MRALPAAIALLAAGCIGNGTVEPELPDDRLAAAPDGVLLPEHDNHLDPVEHEIGYGLEQIAWDPVDGSATSSAGAHALDVVGDRLYVAVWGTNTRPNGGFVIYDISAPERPQRLGSWSAPGPLGGDRSIEVTPDGRYAVVALETTTSLGHVSPGGGLALVDVTDPSQPVMRYRFPAQGVHAVVVAEISGATYAFATAMRPPDLPTVFRIEDTPAGPTLAPVGNIRLSHDAVVAQDPADQHYYLYAADGARELNIWDVTDPLVPELKLTWSPPGHAADDGGRYYVHTTAVFHPDGKRIVVVSSEDWEDYPSPFWVLDATDFGEPVLLGTWSNPWGVGATGLLFSLHNPRADEANGRLVFSHYHGGVLVFPFSTATEWADPQPRAWALPHEDTGWRGDPVDIQGLVREAIDRAWLRADGVPFTMDIELKGDIIYAADLHSGLYVYREPG